MSRSPALIVDGSSWLYRAFHALPRLTGPDGAPTGAIVGMGNMLKKLLREYQPEQIAVVFDPRGKTFRHELYPQYKAQRPPVPPELSAQFEPLTRLVRILGLPLLQIDGFEADDVIATLAGQAEDRPVLVVSGDKDLAQLVDERIHLLDTMKNLEFGPGEVEEKYGVPPAQIVDWLSLMGDSSDNVPGIPGVGAKTAAKWLKAYPDLDAIIESAEEIGGKVGESLRAHLDQLPLARELVTVKSSLALPVSLDELTPGPRDETAYRDFCLEFGLARWLDEIEPAESSPAAAQRTLHTVTILDEKALAELVDTLSSADVYAVDTETDRLDPQQARLVGLSFACAPDQAWYLPVGHDYMGAPDQLPLARVRDALGPLLKDQRSKKIAQHGKYDMHVLRRHDLPLRGLAFDTMLESYVLNPAATRHDMDSLALHHLGHRTISFAEVAGKGKKQLTFNQIDLAQAAPYAGEDAAITYALHQVLGEKLAAEPSLHKVYQEIELPLIEVLAAIEANGVLVDGRLLQQISGEFAGEMETLEARAHAEAGRRFNLNSPSQLKDILFDELGLPAKRKTPKGVPATAEDVLQELAELHALPGLILTWRELAKLRSTYTERLPENINPETGRVHTSYHQAVAATGRLSSADPNLQNIPIRNANGRRIRQAFIAAEGYQLAALDYSQIELRLMAHFSGDQSLCRAFRDGRDIHQATAAEVLGIAPEKVSAEDRRAAKAINFGLIYGISAFGLARQLGIGRGEAQAHMDRFFERYPGVAAYMDSCKAAAREKGYVETLYGRRLYLPEISDRNAARRQAAERVAINAPLQGTAADIIKLAMLAIHQQLGEDEKMIMQVHDELVFELPVDTAPSRARELAKMMESIVRLEVPLKVDLGIGDNWDQAHG